MRAQGLDAWRHRLPHSFLATWLSAVAVLARRHAEASLEHNAEMARIREAAPFGDVGNCQLSFSQVLADAVESDAQKFVVDAAACCRPKSCFERPPRHFQLLRKLLDVQAGKCVQSYEREGAFDKRVIALDRFAG